MAMAAAVAAMSSGGRGIGANDGGRPDIKLFCVLFSSFRPRSTADNDSGLEFGCYTAAPSSSVPRSRTLRHDRECRRATMARNERSCTVCLLTTTTTTTILTTHTRKHVIVYEYVQRYIVVDEKNVKKKLVLSLRRVLSHDRRWRHLDDRSLSIRACRIIRRRSTSPVVCQLD